MADLFEMLSFIFDEYEKIGKNDFKVKVEHFKTHISGHTVRMSAEVFPEQSVTFVKIWTQTNIRICSFQIFDFVIQNMAIFGVKIRPLWQAGSRVGIPSGKCFMCHITPQCMEQHYLGPLLPSPGTHPGFQGTKNGYYWGKNQATMAGCFQVKPSYLKSAWCAISHTNT